MVIVLLDSIGKYTRLGDAQRVKYWLETGESMPATAVKTAAVRPSVKLAKQPKKGTPVRCANNGKARGARPGSLPPDNGRDAAVVHCDVVSPSAQSRLD
jgi:hypothetical protein